jgi:hypothetical protein
MITVESKDMAATARAACAMADAVRSYYVLFA